MAGITIKEFASKLSSSTNGTFKKNNPQLFKPVSICPLDPVRAPETSKWETLRSPEQKLNKLETRWLAVLRTRYGGPIGIQNITLRLTSGVRYTPDLNVWTVAPRPRLICFETKGLHRFREKGILKLKWAATEYPFFDFVLVTWDKDTQQWSETVMPKE